jgi:hypothetical protein
MHVSIRKRPLLIGAVAGLLLSAFGTAPGFAGIPQPPPRDPIIDGPEDADHQHPGPGGHLPGSSENVELVGQVTVSGATGVDQASHIADVATFGNYAYLAARRLNTEPCGAGGVYVIDISDPTDPTEVGFIAFPPQSYPGEGVDVIKLNTPSFKGDVLLTNNENCTNTNPARVGGMSLYDVTNPLAPVPLAIGVGDTNAGTLPRANQIHSVLGWQAGRKAFAVQVDNAEQVTNDVDIFDITNPRAPVFISELGLVDWPGAQAPLANGETNFFHDVEVEKIGGHMYMLLSYWDAGWIILNIDNPANPVFVNDSNYPDPEPLLGFTPPEGNGHQAEWSHNNRFIIGTDEDFSPSRTSFQITTGSNAGFYGAGQFGFTPQISTHYADGQVNGPTVWGGSGCIEDLNGNGTSDRAEVPPASTMTAAPGEEKSVVFTRGFCFFSDKIHSGELAGYDNVIVGQSHGGTGGGLFPNGFTCGGQGSPIDGTATAICTGHRATHLLFNDTPEYTPNECGGLPCSFPPGGDLPAIGTLGEKIHATTTFDGWGTVHLLRAGSLQEVDNYAVSEGIDPAFASGFGTLSIHEVATDPAEDIAYFSYYDAGFRVARFGPGGIEEVGHYIDANGNDFWGVEAHRLPGSEDTLAYLSDRDSGLWIFRYTGP